MLKNKKILLGVTGSVAAYKAVDLVRRLKEKGASVHVIMTDASKRFVTPLSLELASGNRVHDDIFGDPLSHISLTADADLLVVAPATANILGKFAGGIADDMLSTSFLSFRGAVVIAPAMNWRMYENPVVQENLKYLRSLGAIQSGPEEGSLACGEEGMGRMSDVPEIVDAVESALSQKDLAGKKILVTAGPTREYLDPVRFLSNRSSGKMGYAIARAASRRGASVLLVSGPSGLNPPPPVHFIAVETAEEMRDAVIRNMTGFNAVIMAAAVADFSPGSRSESKIEKSETLTVHLTKTPDILSEVGSMHERPFLVGFAAETGARLDRARKKLIEKGADMVVFNDVSREGSGFDTDTNTVTIVERASETPLPTMKKDEVADHLLDLILLRNP